jgi:1-acyl-sn-glycerol-3-phosphate acyltransferase
MHDFDDIRPFRDEEVKDVVANLLEDLDFSRALAKFRHPKWYKWLPGPTARLVQQAMKKELSHVNNIHDVQIVIEKYLDKLIETTATGLTQSGLEQLDPKQPYLFISNHRDITMDPALVNYMLYHHGFDTLQIATGDNLLKRPFLSDLMKLNKSFIVKRSVHGRDKLAASKQLSAYIKHCIDTGQNVWIAQREGRAKDGVDKTEAAIIKMLQLASREGGQKISLGEAMNQLNIVPVAISYEFDPCDNSKAVELHAKTTTGTFIKDENADVQSILTGMIGKKGAIHVSFGTRIVASDTVTAEEVADMIDRQIVSNNRLHAINYLALEKLDPAFMNFRTLPALLGVTENAITAKRKELEQRLQHLDAALHPYVLRMYANPVIRKTEIQLRNSYMSDISLQSQ